MVKNQETGDTYVALTAKNGASILNTDAVHTAPGVEVGELDEVVQKHGRVVEELNFVPYYFLAKRGGKGQMRVGLRRWRR